MKITKVIPQVVKIDTNLIKRNDIFNVTDTLGTYGQKNYIVVNVTNDIIVLRLLEAKKDSELIIRVEDVDRYKFKKMKLVEDTIDLHTEQNSADNEKEEDFTTQLNKKSMEQMVDKMKKKEKEMTKEECEKAVDDYAEKLMSLIFNIDKNDDNVGYFKGYRPNHYFKK